MTCGPPGDIAYDLDHYNGERGDRFLAALHDVFAAVPLLVSPGNHEHAYNFSAFRARFTMPHWRAFENLWYSVDVGPVHLVSFSTEVYFWPESRGLVEAQRAWLEADLRRANANRASRPWVVTMGHRPLYCGTADDCYSDNVTSFNRALLRTELEDLFQAHRVDVQFYAHEHSYERLLPVYNLHLMNTSAQRPYSYPRGPVHVITGSGGNCEGQNAFEERPGPWSAFRSTDIGYNRMQAWNATHMHLDFFSVETAGGVLTGEVIDSITLVKAPSGSSS